MASWLHVCTGPCWETGPRGDAHPKPSSGVVSTSLNEIADVAQACSNAFLLSSGAPHNLVGRSPTELSASQSCTSGKRMYSSSPRRPNGMLPTHYSTGSHHPTPTRPAVGNLPASELLVLSAAGSSLTVFNLHVYLSASIPATVSGGPRGKSRLRHHD